MAKKKLNLRQEYEELQAMEYHLASRSVAFFTRAAWEVLEPETPMLWNYHHDLICEHLQAVDEGQLHRLIINIAPRTMKSILATVCFPSWSWARRPHRRFMCGSYAESLAVKHNMMRRNLIESPWYQRGWGHRFKISSDSNTKAEFTNDKTGQMKSLGIMGSATGFGADCFPAGTMVETESGPLDISILYKLINPPRVLSFNHEDGRFEWRKILARRKKTSSCLVQIRTARGRSITATRCHRVYTQKGYVQAGHLRGGDTLLGVRSNGASANVRCAQGPQKGTENAFLLEPMSSCRAIDSLEEAASMPCQWVRGENFFEKSLVLFKHMQEVNKPSAHPIQTKEGFVWRMRRRIRNALFSSSVLFKKMLWGCSFKKNDENRKLTLHTIKQSFGGDPAHLTGDQKTRREQMCRLRGRRSEEASTESKPDNGYALKSRRSPHRPQLQEQLSVEPNLHLCSLSSIAPQKQDDAVSMVFPLRSGEVDVYDIQVEGNHNFFAEGILVHNCLIVDDPHNPSGAESEAERESTVENFDLAWTSRLNNKKTGAIIVVMQRLHEKDLTGHLLAKNAGYVHLKIPSVAPTRQTLYFPITKKTMVREPGDILHPARDGAAELAAAKKDMGEYGYSGQHDQEPVPRGGAMIKRHWFKVYRERPARFDQIIQSWDFAVKAKTTSDYTVGLVIGRIGAEKYVLDMVREQANFTGQLSMLVALSRKWPMAHKKVIESKANGPAIVAMLQKTVSGLIEVEPDGDKIARMNSISPDIEAGNVWVPDPSIAAWVSDFLTEVCNFPRATHDDTVDALTQGIRELRRASVASMPLAGHSGIIHGR